MDEATIAVLDQGSAIFRDLLSDLGVSLDDPTVRKTLLGVGILLAQCQTSFDPADTGAVFQGLLAHALTGNALNETVFMDSINQLMKEGK